MRLLVGIILILVGATWLLDGTLGLDVPWSLLPSLLLLVIGARLLTLRRGEHVAGWIVLGALVAVWGAAVPVTDGFSLDAGAPGDVEFDVDGGDDIDAKFEHSIGKMTLDLRDLDDSDEGSVHASLGIGELVVRAGCESGADIRAEAGVGSVRTPSGESGGFGPELRWTQDDAGVTVDVRVGIGSVVVRDPGDCTEFEYLARYEQHRGVPLS